MKKIAICLSVLLCLPLCGCWNRREIGKIAIVMGFSIDKGEKENEIEITTQIANTRTIASASESGNSGGGEQKPYLNLSSKGEAIFPTIRSSVTKSGAKLYMEHNYVILFGQEIAEEGLGDYMDFFLRDHELRLDMELLVTRGRGADVLDADTGFQSIPALHIHDLIQAQQQLSTGMPVDILDFTNRLVSGRGAPLIPIVEIDETGDSKALRMVGTAVFSEDKMVGELDERETRGYLWTKSAVKDAVIMAHAGEDRAGIELVRSEGSIKAEVDENGGVSMVITVDAKGSLGSERGKTDFTTKEGVDALLTAFAGEIEGEVRSCLEKAKELDADIFGFSDVLYRHHPKLWNEMQDTAFYDLPVRITVKTHLDSSGRIEKPVE